MDHDRIVALDIENADLEQRAVESWADEQDQVITQKHPSHSVANRVPYVRVDDTMLPGWLTDPHLDKIACLADTTADYGWAPRLYAPQRYSRDG
jgi:hypothetical protein